MPVSAIVELNLDQGPEGAWEARNHYDGAGALLGWRAAAARTGGADTDALYQAESGGSVYLVESGDDDQGEAIRIEVVTKRYRLEGISMLHDLYVRLAGVAAGTTTLSVRAGGSEYGEIAFDYELDCAGDGDLEKRIRLHRELLGVWAQVTLTGSVSHRPEIREMTLRFVPFRGTRASA